MLFIYPPLFSIKMRKDLQANQITNFSFGWFEKDFLFGTEMGLYKQKNTLYVNGKLVFRKGPILNRGTSSSPPYVILKIINIQVFINFFW